jgi:hypothetical protein
MLTLGNLFSGAFEFDYKETLLYCCLLRKLIVCAKMVEMLQLELKDNLY